MKKVGVEIFSYGIISGLVGITAGCNNLNTIESAFIGFMSAIIVHFADDYLTNKFKIDDPLSIVSVHGLAGVWGTIAVGIFADLPENFSRFHFIYVQTLGVFVGFLFAFTLGIILFIFLYKIKLLRVRKKHEVLGLNTSEHNAKLPWVDTIESILSIMKTGNIDKKIYEERDTEVGIVAKFFNYLLNMLRQTNNELKKSNKNLSIKAYRDSLTKAYNRNGLFKHLENKNTLYTLTIIDIDKFKNINDTFGHDIGDSVLVELSSLIMNNIRDNDIFARWGGEEFLIVFDNNNLEVTQNICEELRKKIEKFNFSTVKNITASFGVSNLRANSESFDDALKRADKALYEAKNGGRNRIYVY